MFFRKTKNISFQETEKHEWGFYIQYLEEGMTVFDVGANAGELTSLFSHFSRSSGCVHAFEPTPSTFNKLKMTMLAARAKNIVINNLALSKSKGEMVLHEYEEQFSGLNTAADRPLKDQGFDIEPVRKVTVPCDTIDHYCAEHKIDRIDLLKIDVEGSELDVLLGAEQMFQNQLVKCCVFEFGQTTIDMGNNAEEFHQFFHKHRYGLRNLINKQPVMPIKSKGKGIAMSLNVAMPR